MCDDERVTSEFNRAFDEAHRVRQSVEGARSLSAADTTAVMNALAEQLHARYIAIGEAAYGRIARAGAEEYAIVATKVTKGLSVAADLRAPLAFGVKLGETLYRNRRSTLALCSDGVLRAVDPTPVRQRGFFRAGVRDQLVSGRRVLQSWGDCCVQVQWWNTNLSVTLPRDGQDLFPAFNVVLRPRETSENVIGTDDLGGVAAWFANAASARIVNNNESNLPVLQIAALTYYPAD